MIRGRAPSAEAVIRYMRHRRKTYFFGDKGPALPRGISARWRSSLSDPHGWHSNMIGVLEGDPALLDAALGIAIGWFERRYADTWVDADEFGLLFRHQDVLERRGFTLHDDWEVMACWKQLPTTPNPAVSLREAQTRADFMLAARIAEEAEMADGSLTHRDVEQRAARYWREYTDWNSCFLIAWLHGEAVGTARLTDEEVPVIVGVATLPAAQRQGVATTLTSALVAQALHNQGVCALYVERDSQAARIYRRIGFQPLFRSRAWVRRLRKETPASV